MCSASIRPSRKFSIWLLPEIPFSYLLRPVGSNPACLEQARKVALCGATRLLVGHEHFVLLNSPGTSLFALLQPQLVNPIPPELRSRCMAALNVIEIEPAIQKAWSHRSASKHQGGRASKKVLSEGYKLPSQRSCFQLPRLTGPSHTMNTMLAALGRRVLASGE